MRKYFIPVLLCCLAMAAKSQILVNSGVSATALVAGMAGNGLTITNVVINCPTNAYGTFSNGSSSNLGLNNGAVFTTGSASGVRGPNNTGSYGTCNGTSGGDPSLVAIEPQATNDNCTVEFDFVPQCSQLTLRFVFGSEEYPEFVNASFNDAFGLFISGPGPACQAGFYNNTNVATLPNNTTPVSIDNVNGSNNSGYYVNNSSGATIQYDGFTTVLTRNVNICPCQTYHFKIAIADAGDCYYDSGVFIEFLQCTQFMAGTVTQTAATCGNTNGSASITMTNGAGPYTYSWSPAPGGGQGTATATGLTSGTTYTVTVNDAVSCSSAFTKTITVGAPTPITAVPSRTNALCNGSSSGIGQVTPSNGTAPYTYTWSPSGGNAATAGGLSAGIYTVNVKDANNCTVTSTLQITQPTVLVASSSASPALCSGGTGSAAVTVSGGTAPYSYTWNPSGGNAAMASGLVAGVYTVSIADDNNCSITRTVSITQPAALAAIVSSTNSSCNASDGVANVVVSGGTGPYTYTWNPSGGNAATVMGLGPGTYTVMVNDAHACPKTATVAIAQPPSSTLSIAAGSIACYGGTATATVSVSGGLAPYTYTWNPSGGNGVTASGLTAGDYTIAGTDANGCVNSQTFSITQPASLMATPSQTNVSCNGANNGLAAVSVSGGTAPYTYTWSPSGGNASTATGLGPGSYTVAVRDANQCSLTRVVSITEPLLLLASATQTNVSCYGASNGTVQVSAGGGTGPYTYTWSPSGGNAAIASGLGQGSYTVAVGDANACLQTATVVLSQPPPTTLSISASSVSCFGQSNGSGTVSASGGTPPYTYTWSPFGGNASVASSLTSGNYTVSITDAQGCLSATTVAIAQPLLLTASTIQASVACNGLATGAATVNAAGGTGPYTYTWSPTGGNASVAAGLPAGTYTVSVSDANACANSRTLSITQPASLTAISSATDASCHGSNNGLGAMAVSGGTSPYSYTWSPSGGNAATATNLMPGSYTLSINDANNCNISSTLTITEPPMLAAAVTQTNVSCHGGANGAAGISAGGGTTPYTYSWSPSGGTGPVATGLTAGSYTVSVRDAQLCALSQTVVITEPAALAAPVSQSSVTCYGLSNGSASATASGGTGPYTYTWNPSGGNAPSATGLAAGGYTLTLRDANGCALSSTVSINQPTQFTVSAVSASVACNSQSTGSGTVSVSGATGPYTYTWSPSGGNAFAAANLAAGNYTIAIADANQCATSASLSILQPAPLVAAMSHTDVPCYGAGNGIAAIVAGGGIAPYTYTWSPSGGNAATTGNLLPGSYTVVLNDANACTLSRTVSIGEAAQYTISIAGNSVTCNGLSNGSGTVSVTGATPPYTYTWSPSGGNGATASGLATGTYSVLIRDAKGCSRTQTLSIVQPSVLSATTTHTDISCYGSGNGQVAVTAIGGTGAYTYTWLPSGAHTATLGSLVPGNYMVTTADANLCSTTRTVQLIQPAQYTVAASTASILCNGQSTGSASLSVSGNTPAYTYTWNPSGGNGAIASGLAPGTYSITISDAHNCPTSQTLTITQPAALSGSLSSSPANCNNADGTATVTVAGGQGAYTYTWSPAGGNAAVSTGILSGSYTCTVRDANNCSLSLNGMVAVINPSVSLVASSYSICPGQSTTLGASGSSTYTWNPSINLSSPNGPGVIASPTASTVYTVTGANPFGCTATNTIGIHVYANPVIAVSAASSSVCAGNSTTLTAGGASSYTWSPTAGLGTINSASTTATPAGTQTYSVAATDNLGCIGTATIAIGVWALPTLSVSASNATVCANDPSILTVTGASSYTWNTGSTANPYTVTPSVSTAYSVTGQDINGCLNSTTLTVPVNQPPVVSISGSTVVCQGSNATLSANGAATYTWSTAATGASVSVTPGTTSTFTVIGTDANGCRDTSSFLLTVYVTPTLGITGKDQVCEDDELTLTASGGSNGYVWSTGDNTTSITYPYTSSTLVSVSSGTSPCIGTTTFAVNVNLLPSASAAASPTAIIVGQATQLTGTTTGTQYQWQPDAGLSCSSCPDPVAHPGATTVYTLTVTDANGCKNTSTTLVYVEMICGEVFAPSAFSPNEDGNNDTWCVYGNCIRFLQCDIFNRWGQKVYTIMDKNDCWDGKVNGVLQNSGVYIYQLSAGLSNGETRTQKGNFTLVR